MTSRELVYSTLDFNHKERLARQLWYLPWADIHYKSDLEKIKKDFPDDIVVSPIFYTKEINLGDVKSVKNDIKRTANNEGLYKVGKFIDEWGCEFTNIQEGVVGEVKNPFIRTWDDLEKVKPPFDTLSIDIDQINAFCKSTDQFVISGCILRPFERLQFLRGSESLYMDFLDNRDEIEKALKIIHNFYTEEAQMWAKTNVDALWLMDDWGTQNNLLISPNDWKELFKPLYKDYIDIAHSHGKKAFMHSDGNTLAIIPELIDLGLDAFNTQIFCIGIDNLAKFKGKITFWGEIDRQHILSFGTKEEVYQGVTHMYDTLYANGGVIAQCEFGAGAKPDNVYSVYECFNALKA